MRVIISRTFHILLPGDFDMKKQNWKTYALWILLSEAVGAVSGWVSRDGMRYYSEAVAQPPLSPPPIVFPFVWGILFLLMGIGAARVALTPASPQRSSGLNLFVSQLIVNFFWSIIFFNFRAFLFAFIWLLLLLFFIIKTVLAYRPISPLAAYLQIPYLLWVAFAGYLNFGIFYLN